MAAEVSDQELATEVDRAVRETRGALSNLASRRCLPPPLMGMSTLLDRVEIAVTAREGESAFELHEEGEHEAIHFRVEVLRKIFLEVREFTDEIGMTDPDEARRAQQMAVNLFIVHELMHIRQNFPSFASVSMVKAGLPGFGLPIFDLVADIVSAWICAHVEAERNGITNPEEILPAFVTTLTLSYTVGAFVFDGRTNPGKRQRLLGIVVSTVLAKAKIEGVLCEEHIQYSWRPTSPVLVLNIEECRVFNAMVVDAMSGLLLGADNQSASKDAEEFWESVGLRPISKTFSLASVLLKQAGAIR
jgi:hypothetical protein